MNSVHKLNQWKNYFRVFKLTNAIDYWRTLCLPKTKLYKKNLAKLQQLVFEEFQKYYVFSQSLVGEFRCNLSEHDVLNTLRLAAKCNRFWTHRR